MGWRDSHRLRERPIGLYDLQIYPARMCAAGAVVECDSAERIHKLQLCEAEEVMREYFSVFFDICVCKFDTSYMSRSLSLKQDPLSRGSLQVGCVVSSCMRFLEDGVFKTLCHIKKQLNRSGTTQLHIY